MATSSWNNTIFWKSRFCSHNEQLKPPYCHDCESLVWFIRLGTIELCILTRALTCSAFWRHPERRHVWCVAWLRNDFNFKRTHIAAIFYIRRVRFRTRLPIRARPRYENRNFDSVIDVLKKVYAPWCSQFCTLISRLCVHICWMFCFDDTQKRTNAPSCK